ncbi:cadherin-like domain-containing protein [Roseomonas fluvialis]|uniref:DUF4232 domain-containing protein n=1 Tax=Roseomonas fluvialis TaxID=1750527 RepID=A0ABN6P3S1_9PROT|nr:cadherin-like domain-containing protein [Roseomonas fluvialis]BDG73306.1 hypothetical protein Rmf_32350 [Roseomonas fluvialis]
MRGAIGAVAMALLGGAPAVGQSPATPGPTCEVPPFRGMTQPGGADARMSVSNTGGSCRIRLWADVEARQPFASVTLTRPPTQGSVTILPEGVAYRPNPGYRGPDLFEVAASGTVRGNPISGRIRVEVTVLPPP